MTPTLKSIFNRKLVNLKPVNRKLVQSLLVFASLLAPAQLFAATVNIASAPLVSATTTQVLPNLMYILDNSGSMARDYMPDYVIESNKCKTTGSSGAFSSGCEYGDPPYNASAFNTIYYNPAINYAPASNSVGTDTMSMTSANTAGWTAVPIDAYGVFSNSTTSLVPNADRTEGYRDIVWCNKTSGITAADKLNTAVCKQNSQYIYPNYSNPFSQTTSFNQSYTLRGHPFYYTVSPGEYCTDANLTSCVVSTVPTATHTFPATLRWCNSSGRTNCQAKFLETGTFTFAKWSGINSGSASEAKIKINADTNGASPVALSVTDITVDGVRIIPPTPSPALTITDTTNSGQRSALATNIRDAINDVTGDDFTATVTGDEVTITYTGASLPFTGTVTLTASSGPASTVPGDNAAGSITFNRARNSATMTNITVNTSAGAMVIMNSTVTTTSSENTSDFATKVKNAINALTVTSGYSASCSGGTNCSNGTVNIVALNVGAQFNGTISTFNEGSARGATDTSGSIRYTTSALAGGANQINAGSFTIPNTITQFSGGTPVVNTFNRVNIEPSTLSYPKVVSRTDCAGSTCTYDEEMTNFANWFSYYRTRMQMMKTSTSRAFKTIDTRYRVGFITINSASSNYLPIAQFGSTQKGDWYAKLFATGANDSTPLRQSLSQVGRVFAGKNPVSGFSSDPVQYSCQQNFALLTTDGYWNGSGGVQINGSTAIGNLDGTGTGRPQFEGPSASSNSLADAAKYYYDIDLRNSSQGNCTGALGTDVCEDNVFVSPTDNNQKQHMTTFTLGLGVDGELAYTSDYRNATSGDYFEIRQGTKNWSVPAADTQRAVDDLWHAAVNGQGTYFSARDPNQLNTSLTDALQSIGAKVGAGAAAATSTLNPVAGDNFAYVASYSTVKWTGNLEAREINLQNGEVSEDATWCVENVAASSCAAPSSIVSEDVSGATVAYCVTPSATAATCPSPGILNGAECKVEIATSCTGSITDNVGPNLSSRNILIKDGATNNLVSFNYANLSPSHKPFFENAFLSTNLSQWSTLSPAQQAIAGGDNIVNFLRGETGFEDRASNLVGPDDNRIFRFREATMGDALESTPIFVGAEKLNYSDANYGPLGDATSFKEAQKNRPGTVYLGTNDGMLHAFNTANGEERWAYVPSMVIPNMYKLADKNYATSHTNFVNGDAIVGSICHANCNVSGSGGAAWKTILVGGLNGGGRGYYALDVTDPTTPSLLWEFTPTSDNDLGVSFGNAEITKKADGTWVVLITSGYNNTTGDNPGKGILYVLNANTGTVISKYKTNVGDATTPSGLAKISAFINEPNINNSALYVYGGDLLGNLWRFDINAPEAAGTNPFKFAALKDPSGNPQPITVKPTLSDVSGKRLIIIGTGKYLEIPDLTNMQQQSLYAMSDDSSVTATLDNPRLSGTMVSQTLVNDGATRNIQQPENVVNYATGRGWYIDLPDSGERQNIAARFVAGVTLLVPTIVPSNTVCSPGGYGWLNFVNYKTGAVITNNVVAAKTNAPIVGINVIYIKGKPVVSVVTADNPTPEKPSVEPPAPTSSKFTNRRMIWRELLEDE